MFNVEGSRNAGLLILDCTRFVDAAAVGDVATVRHMIERGMDPDSKGTQGWTALRKAAIKNKYEVAFELLRRGASVDARNHFGQTALLLACAYGHHEMASLLLFYGADPNLGNSGGQTPLMIAASKGHVLVVGALLDAGRRIDINQTDHGGKSALHCAIEFDHDNITKMLEAAGAKNPAVGFAASPQDHQTREGFLTEASYEN
jgi:ankyrin repeat protein